MAISPYTRRGFVDHTVYTTVDMIRSIELMLGLEPKNRLDWADKPLISCFSDKPDFTPYTHVLNKIPLDERNPQASQLSAEGKEFLKTSLSLDWTHLDGPDPEKLRRINWFSATKGRPYPEQYEDRNRADEDDD
jgi:hypothetical protein